jgi:hypothetical protein
VSRDYIIEAPVLVDVPLDELVRLISPAVDRYLKTTGRGLPRSR